MRARSGESLSAEAVLGPDGPVARELGLFEDRPQQRAMAAAVERSLADGRHLLVEAGTGVGKSFAYLVPAVLAAARGKGPIAVSTHTIALQEQLVLKDLPFLDRAGIVKEKIRFAIAKGRGNYLSKRRLAAARRKPRSLFPGAGPAAELERLGEWAQTAGEGSVSEIVMEPSKEVWSAVRSEHDNCLGRDCPTYGECFYYAMRRKLCECDIIVVNHALLLMDLALKDRGVQFLPEFAAIIVDEAHTLESIASEHLGTEISSTGIDWLLRALWRRDGESGLVPTLAPSAEDLVRRAVAASAEFFEALRVHARSPDAGNGRIRRSGAIPNGLSSPLLDLGQELKRVTLGLERKEDQVELAAHAERCVVAAMDLERILGLEDSGAVSWVEVTERGRAAVRSAPVPIAPALRRLLFSKGSPVILTSATLTVGRERSFRFVRKRFGIEEEDAADELALDSPFDFGSQALLVVRRDLPDPRDEAYGAALAERILPHLDAERGGAFVLFTSYGLLNRVHALLEPALAERGRLVLKQGAGKPRTQMLDEFRAAGSAVLFGTDSFWEGVDVPGDALRMVILTRLPFSSPDHPLGEARLEAVRAEGLEPFRNLSLPEAVLKFRQGFGRLIRRRTDTGTVVVLDPRVLTKGYGRVFLDSVPECPVTIEGVDDGEREG